MEYDQTASVNEYDFSIIHNLLDSVLWRNSHEKLNFYNRKSFFRFFASGELPLAYTLPLLKLFISPYGSTIRTNYK